MNIFTSATNLADLIVVASVMCVLIIPLCCFIDYICSVYNKTTPKEFEEHYRKLAALERKTREQGITANRVHSLLQSLRR